jgi:sulfonate transport system permease protein
MIVLPVFCRLASWLWPRLVPWLIPAALLLIWQEGVRHGWIAVTVLPAPLDIARAFLRLSASGELLMHMKISCLRALLGFACGAAIGLGLGIWTGHSRAGERVLDTSIQMLRNIPHLALTPLVILWFGIGEEAKLFLIALGVMFPVYLNTFHGIRSVDRQLIEMGRCYGLSGMALFRHVTLPGALPSIMVGIRYALGVMWLTLIVAETISASSGIGYMAMNAREFFQTDVIVLAILIYALLGKLADLIAKALERRLLCWRMTDG